jgi:hypothetical protein
MPRSWMDDFQKGLVPVGLGLLTDYGFAFADGYAHEAHHLVDRMSKTWTGSPTTGTR